MSTLVIAEIGSSHDNDLSKARRLIDAAKECGANVAKGQWTSNAQKMAQRRGLGKEAADMYAHYLQKPVSWLEALKSHCDSVGIEWACTSYLIEDIATIAPLVKRFKVSAFEAKWQPFVDKHRGYGKPVVMSVNPSVSALVPDGLEVDLLYCVSEYPTALEHLKLNHSGLRLGCDGWIDGLSDHTANVLTGAAAVAAGAKIIEAHIRLYDTDEKNPDYGHSLPVQESKRLRTVIPEGWDFNTYVQNIRTVERML